MTRTPLRPLGARTGAAGIAATAALVAGVATEADAAPARVNPAIAETSICGPDSTYVLDLYESTDFSGDTLSFYQPDFRTDTWYNLVYISMIRHPWSWNDQVSSWWNSCNAPANGSTDYGGGGSKLLMQGERCGTNPHYYDVYIGDAWNDQMSAAIVASKCK